MTQNQIAFYKAKTEAKHMRRQDREAKRHNQMTEALTGQELSIKDWANRANVALGYEQAAINRSHYTASDFNNQVANQLKTDQLVLDWVGTFGAPKYVVGKDGKHEPKYITISDYYNPGDALLAFDVREPVALNYLSPGNMGNIGKMLSGASAALNTVDKVINSIYYRSKSKE